MQTPWYRIELAGADHDAWRELRRDFDSVCRAAGLPAGMMMYCASALAWDEPLVFYFSPDCAPFCTEFFRRWGATHGRPPSAVVAETWARQRACNEQRGGR